MENKLDQLTVREVFDQLDYHEFAEFQSLTDNDKAYFDELYKILIIKGEITYSNAKLAEITNCKQSTLEKRLARIEKAGLIVREHAKQKDFDGTWRVVDRVIKLNPELFEFSFESVTHYMYCIYIFLQRITPSANKYFDMKYGDFKEFSKELKKDVTDIFDL